VIALSSPSPRAADRKNHETEMSILLVVTGNCEQCGVLIEKQRNLTSRSKTHWQNFRQHLSVFDVICQYSLPDSVAAAAAASVDMTSLVT